jgi:hypothetical protein
MPIEFVKHYTREEIRANKTKIYVFGDNFTRTGFGGQAREARGEINTVGIPTKWLPSNQPSAFLNDEYYSFVQPVIAGEFRKLFWYLKAGYTVVWPSDGIGTGRARLREVAPKIDKMIDQMFRNLQEYA